MLRAEPEQRLDLSALTPERLSKLARGEVERLALNTTRAQLCVADAFSVYESEPERVVIEGGSSRFDNIGAAISGGELIVVGDAGVCVGRAMSGGRIEIRGNVGGWAASGLTGGQVEIRGDAGERLGGPLAGERTGMSGGAVVLRGNAGERAGDRLRRGLIVIESDAGANPASRMIAGTLVVCGRAGALPGYLMRRGTLVLARAPELLAPTFIPVGGADPTFLRLFERALEPLSRRAASLFAALPRRLAGDMAVLGKGEILIAATEAA